MTVGIAVGGFFESFPGSGKDSLFLSSESSQERVSTLDSHTTSANDLTALTARCHLVHAKTPESAWAGDPWRFAYELRSTNRAVGAASGAADPVSTLRWPSNAWVTARVDSMVGTVQEELLSYLSYPVGWDGYRGEAFSVQLVSIVIEVSGVIHDFLRQTDTIPAEFEPGPASDGSIDLDLCVDERRLTLTFYGGEEAVAIYTEDEGGCTEICELLTKQGLEARLDWLCGTKVSSLTAGNS